LLDLPDAEKDERGLAHTPQEIAQQPQTWLGTYALLRAQQAGIQQFLTAAGLLDSPEQRPTVFLIGAGTSDYIGHSLHHLLRSQWQCEVLPVASTDLLTDFPDYILSDRKYLWISFSRSGDSPEGVAVLERALAEYPNICHLLITCNAAGRMMSAIKGRGKSYSVVLDDATNDRGLAMTSSFTNMVLAGQILAHAWKMEDYQPVLQALVQSAEAFLPRAPPLWPQNWPPKAITAPASWARECWPAPQWSAL